MTHAPNAPMTTRTVTAARPPDPGRTPVQRRVWSLLLDADARRTDRPPADTGIGSMLRRATLEQLAADLARVSPDTTVWLNATALAALACEGRYLDHLDTDFAWSLATAAGSVTQHALALEVEGGGLLPLADLVDSAWERTLDSGSTVARYVRGLDPARQTAVRATVSARCGAFRDSFPRLPAWLHTRVATPLTWRLSRQVVAKVVPDLMVGRPDAERRLVQMVSLKSGARLPTHADERRLQALLATVKYGVAPYRVATYYLDEGDWAADDVTDAYLAGALDHLVVCVRRAVHLTAERPKPAHLQLRAGAACNWCRRAPDCPLGGSAATTHLEAA